MQERKNDCAAHGAGWTGMAVSAVLFASSLASVAVVIGALFPSLNGMPTAAPAGGLLVAPCVMVGLATGTLGFFVARGSIPGRRATEWTRARGIVIATFGIVCGIWASGPTLLFANELIAGRWNGFLLIDVLIPMVVFLCVRWTWPATLTPRRQDAGMVKGDV